MLSEASTRDRWCYRCETSVCLTNKLHCQPRELLLADLGACDNQFQSVCKSLPNTFLQTTWFISQCGWLFFFIFDIDHTPKYWTRYLATILGIMYLYSEYLMDLWPCPQCSWWRHQMETFSALLALCAGNSPLTKTSDDELWCFFYLCLNKRLSKQPWGWWFETPSCSLWRHCDVIIGCCLTGTASEVILKDMAKITRYFITVTS